jgi:hypothetical protein
LKARASPQLEKFKKEGWTPGEERKGSPTADSLPRIYKFFLYKRISRIASKL